MKKYILGLFFIVVIIIVAVALFLKSNKDSEPFIPIKNGKVDNHDKKLKDMKLTSSAFNNQESIPSKYTCDGEDINPPLTIGEVPSGAKSLAIVVNDPDAPAGDWIHWILWNVSPDTKDIKEGELPVNSVQGLNDFKEVRYGGPCPPSGTHNYRFKVYALDTNLNIESGSRVEEFIDAVKGHVIEEALLIGRYKRS